MKTETTTTTTSGAATDTDISVARAFFDAVSARNFAKVGALLHADATWNHRNSDRFGGIHRGAPAIAAFMNEAMKLTDGTLQPEPESFMADGSGRVAVLIRLKGTRTDGRVSDDVQVLLLNIDANRVRTIDHFVGDPAAVTTFWA